MEENKKEEVAVSGQVNTDQPVTAPAPVAEQKPEAPKAPPTIEEVEKKHFQDNHASNHAREIERRQQIDPDKSKEEIEKEFAAKQEQQKAIDAAAPTSLAHSNDPGLETGKN